MKNIVRFLIGIATLCGINFVAAMHVVRPQVVARCAIKRFICYKPLISQVIKYVEAEVSCYSQRKIVAHDCLNREVGRIDYSYISSNPSIDHFYIKPEFRRQGVGSELVSRFLSDVRKKSGSKDVYLEAMSYGSQGVGLDGLVAFYEKHGAIVLEKKLHSVDMKFPAVIQKDDRGSHE